MRKEITVSIEGVAPFIPAEEIVAAATLSQIHIESLLRGDGQGNEFLGWMNLPDSMLADIDTIKDCAATLCNNSELTVVVGIGGSYLGSKAIVEAINGELSPQTKKPGNPLLFAGHTLCPDYMHDLLTLLREKEFSLIVISKSGTTTEPAVAFRLLRRLLEEKKGKKGAAERIAAVTDPLSGALRKMAEREGYHSFPIPSDVGGRYSVLSAAGLLPLAAAGIDIEGILSGAARMKQLTSTSVHPASNPALLYAAARNLLYRSGFSNEILVTYTPRMSHIAEWWKQLFGESEGKEGKGIFPSSVTNTTDLHSMGQYIQEGERKLFETVIKSSARNSNLKVPEMPGDKEGGEDHLGYLAGKSLEFINESACEGTTEAHIEGGVPNIRIEMPAIDEYYLGELLWLFMLSCAVSGYTLGVNPFDQPGVEAYKREMFRLLGR